MELPACAPTWLVADFNEQCESQNNQNQFFNLTKIETVLKLSLEG